MARQFLLLIGLCGLATVFYYAEDIARELEPSTKNQIHKVKVARISKLSGTVERLGQSREKLKMNDEIYAGDTLRTGSSTKLHIKMSSGHRVSISANAQVNLHKWMDKYVIYRDRGLVKLLNSSGAVDQLVIADDKQANFIEENLSADTDLPKDPVQMGLTRDQIRAGIRTLHPQLQRCYLQLVKSGMAKGGRVVINFKIMPRGKVEDIKIGSSTFGDDSFHQCLSTVISRAQYPRFEGKAISSNYPMSFK